MNAPAPSLTPATSRGRILAHLLWAPWTWAPFVPSVALFTFGRLPFWVDALALGASAAVVAGLWGSSWGRIRRLLSQESAAEARKRRRQALQQRVHPLADPYRHKAHEALDLVERIEDRIASAPWLASLEFRDLARGIFEEVVVRLLAVHAHVSQARTRTEADRQSLQEALNGADRGLQSLRETLELVEAQAASGQPAAASGGASGNLDQMIARLREERDLAEAARARVRREQERPPVVPPTHSEDQGRTNEPPSAAT